MEDIPLVSIITVCYNSEEYIENTIESVLNQTYNNIEYIIVDGKSTDGTLDIIKKYKPKFGHRMKWISEEDDGIYDAMNKGIEMASGTIIGILNSDDWYNNLAVENIVNCFLNNSNVVLVHGNMAKYNVEGDLITIYGQRKNKFDFVDKTPFSHPTCFVKKKIYDDLGKFNLDFETAADYDLMLRIYKSEYHSVYIDKLITNVRMVGVTTNSNWPSFIEIYKVLSKNDYNILYRGIGIIYRFFRAMVANIISCFGFESIFEIRRYFSNMHKETNK